jgi:hypothetical protein
MQATVDMWQHGHIALRAELVMYKCGGDRLHTAVPTFLYMAGLLCHCNSGCASKCAQWRAAPRQVPCLQDKACPSKSPRVLLGTHSSPHLSHTLRCASGVSRPCLGQADAELVGALAIQGRASMHMPTTRLMYGGLWVALTHNSVCCGLHGPLFCDPVHCTPAAAASRVGKLLRSTRGNLLTAAMPGDEAPCPGVLPEPAAWLGVWPPPCGCPCTCTAGAGINKTAVCALSTPCTRCCAAIAVGLADLPVVTDAVPAFNCKNVLPVISCHTECVGVSA